MFQQFANYLLGSVSASTDEEASAAATDRAEGVENDRLRLTSTADSEEDWVLVDRDSEGNSEFSSVESLDGDEEDGILVVEEDLDLDVRLRPAPTSTALLERNSKSLFLLPSTAEESWFLTPPPCFISTGPVVMQTSPLENLLIEHPSMSVYTRHGRRYSAGSCEDTFDIMDHDEVVDVEEEEDHVVVVRRNIRINRLHVIQQHEKQHLRQREAQKVQIKKGGKPLNRGPMDRNNKAREVNSRNRRQRRGERSQGATRSYANNNRKC